MVLQYQMPFAQTHRPLAVHWDSPVVEQLLPMMGRVATVAQTDTAASPLPAEPPALTPPAAVPPLGTPPEGAPPLAGSPADATTPPVAAAGKIPGVPPELAAAPSR
jgi:hypothetical protein